MEARQMIEGLSGIGNATLVERVVEKWSELLSGLPMRTEADRYRVAVTAMLVENQARYLRSLSEEVRAINVGPYTKSLFPLLLRMVPNLIAPEVVSVQPLTGPVGAVFYYDWQYGSTKGPTTRGNIFPKDFDPDYTSEYINGEILNVGDGAAFGGGGTALAGMLAWAPVRPLNAGEGYKVLIREINATTGAVVQEATDDGVGGFTFVPTGGSVAGTINYSNGGLTGFKFQNIPANGNPIRAFYYYDSELNTAIPEMNFDIKSAPVTPKARRAKALTSQDAVEDLKALHGLDADATVVSNLALQFGLEIDRGIINEIFKASVETADVWDRAPPGGVPEIDHLRSIFTVMSSLSGQVHKKTLRAPANFAITSVEVGALVDQFASHADYRGVFVPDGQPLLSTPMDMGRPITQHGQFGIARLGLLKNKWSLYEDPFFSRDFMVLGLKGPDFLDAGFVYAPYIPIQFTPTFYDPSDQSLRKGVRTRYAQKLVRSSYYAQLRLLNL